MKKTWKKSLLSLFLCLVLLAAAAMSALATAEESVSVEAPSELVIPATETEPEIVISLQGTEESPVVIGDGEKVFIFTAKDLNDHAFWFEVHTDSEFLGEALLNLHLIAGSESEWGLYVTSVCGITADGSEENPGYWMLYANDEMTTTGVDTTPVESDVHYVFQIQVF